MIEFIPVKAEDLPQRALEWLKISVRKTPGSQTSLEEILSGDGQFYLVKYSELIGAIYLEWTPGSLNIVLLGGDNIKEWRNEMHDFCVKLIRERGISTIMFMGRYGLGKIFPQFKSIGMVYRYEEGV